MFLHFHFRLFIALSLCFVLFTIIGTLSHEWGHYIVARILGYDARIRYAMCSVKFAEWTPHAHRIWFSLGGPIQTMLTGTLGLLLLYLKRKEFTVSEKLTWWQWGLVLVTLFWLRQSANMTTGIFNYFTKSGTFMRGGDEARLSWWFGMPAYFLDITTGTIGFMVLAVVVFFFIPNRQRFIFLLAGLAGGVAGYWLWLEQWGPILMP